MSTIYVIAIVGDKGGVVWDHPLTEKDLDAFLDQCLEVQPNQPVPSNAMDHPLCKYLVAHGCDLPLENRTELTI